MEGDRGPTDLVLLYLRSILGARCRLCIHRLNSFFQTCAEPTCLQAEVVEEGSVLLGGTFVCAVERARMKLAYAGYICAKLCNTISYGCYLQTNDTFASENQSEDSLLYLCIEICLGIRAISRTISTTVGHRSYSIWSTKARHFKGLTLIVSPLLSLCLRNQVSISPRLEPLWGLLLKRE